MAVDLLAKLRELLASADDGDADEAEGIGESGADEVEGDEVEGDEVEGDEVEGDEVEQAGDGATDAAEAEVDDAEQTMPASEVAESELRDSLVTLGAENESLRATNEALRTRLAELGGDLEIEVDETEAGGGTEADVPDPYDDDAATLDLDKQRAEIASLMGT